MAVTQLEMIAIEVDTLEAAGEVVGTQGRLLAPNRQGIIGMSSVMQLTRQRDSEIHGAGTAYEQYRANGFAPGSRWLDELQRTLLARAERTQACINLALFTERYAPLEYEVGPKMLASPIGQSACVGACDISL